MARVTFVGVLLRIVWPLFLLILFLSIGLNAFFLTVERFREGTSVHSSSVGGVPQQENLARGPKAFGVLELGLKPKKQNLPPALKAIAGYQLSGTGLTALPANAPVYRDQGAATDAGNIRDLLAALGVSSDAFSMNQPLFARSIVLKTADNATELSIDSDLRTITVRKTDVPGVLFSQGTQQADDAEAEALAEQYGNALGINTASFGDSSIQSPAPGLARVTWDAEFGGYPLFMADGSRAAALSVDIDRTTKKAIGLTMNLLQPNLLSWSAYPVANPSSLMNAFQTGGLLPLTSSLSKNGQTVPLSNPELGYIVIPATPAAPLYILPIIIAHGQVEQTCKGCGMLQFQTFVPAVDSASLK